MKTTKKHVVHDVSLKGFYAGFVSRLIAFVIDAGILTVTMIILGWTVTTVLTFFGLSPSTINMSDPNLTLRDYITNVIGIIIIFSIPIVTFLIWVTYYIGSWVLMGQTIGKQLLGLKIVSIDNTQVSLKQGIVRYFGYWLSAIPLFAGYWWVLMDNDRRAWHDHLAKTCVIYVWDARTGPRLRDLLLRAQNNSDEQAT